MIEPLNRTEVTPETEDLALLFVEEELGRFHWRDNWLKTRRLGTARERVQAWLEAVDSNHDPDAIIEFLDRVAQERSGRWL
jgi:hypothetical protein